jgi:hypothetical protein
VSFYPGILAFSAQRAVDLPQLQLILPYQGGKTPSEPAL